MHASVCKGALAVNVQADTGKAATPFAEAVEADGRGRVELANALGIDPVTLWRWMEGRSRPRSEATRRLAAQVLGRSVDELWPPDIAAAQLRLDA